MLPPRHRMRRGSDFADAVRRGRRAGRPTVVAHLAQSPADGPPLVGLVVPKAVGTAVVRTRTKRRLRHLMRARVRSLPTGARVVVRAQAPAATATSTALARDLDTVLGRLLDRSPSPAGASSVQPQGSGS